MKTITYLKLCLTTGVCLKNNLDTLEGQASTSIYKLYTIVIHYPCIPIKVHLELFDKRIYKI